MRPILIYPAGKTKACTYAGQYLKKHGLSVTHSLSSAVTHLLLDIPSLSSDGTLRCGESLTDLILSVPESTVLIGGHLDQCNVPNPKIDLLADPQYLAQNAAITADCALQIARSSLSSTLFDTPALIIGWGRIGKCLSQQLSALRCPITIAARNPFDRAIAEALGLHAVDIPEISDIISEIRLIFNTVPAKILGEEILDSYPDCIKIDLASLPGLSGNNIISARGLPGRYAPESSGRLIASTIFRLIKEGSF